MGVLTTITCTVQFIRRSVFHPATLCGLEDRLETKFIVLAPGLHLVILGALSGMVVRQTVLDRDVNQLT